MGLRKRLYSLGMQKVETFVKIVKDVWNVNIDIEKAKDILNQHPDILSRYNLQKQIFGFNMFSNGGHKSTKNYE